MREMNSKRERNSKLDYKRFLPTVIIIVIVLSIVVIYLEEVRLVVEHLYSICAGTFGWIFILANLCALLFSVWIILGPYKNIRIGGLNAKPEYSTFSWITMMFTTSCSAGLIVFGFIEPIYYAALNIPMHGEAYTIQTYEYAQMYAHYHWGMNAWSLYVPATIAIAYGIYNRNKNNVRMSLAYDATGNRNGGNIGSYMIDMVSLFGVVMAPTTSMGLGMPLLTGIIQEICGIPQQYEQIIQISILILWMAVFGTSVCLGINKGIKNLSNINAISAFVFMGIVGILAGAFYIFRAEINTVGMYIQNFVRMVTYTDPYGDGVFVQKWTIWYWAWLIVYMPLMGIFNARISKGRTLRQVALGQMIWCSLGCWIAMMTLGNYSIKLQMSGNLDIASVLEGQGQAAAILEILKTMPYPKIMMAALGIICLIFMATTVDSSSFVAAEMTTKGNGIHTLASRSSRVIWAAVICAVTVVLLKVGGFDVVQVLAILTGLPLAFVMFIVIICTVRTLRKESNENTQ